MDYKDYEIEDFLADAFFVAWVRNPDVASEHFWSKWLGKHPEKAALVKEAKVLVLSARYKYTYEPTEQDYLRVLEKIHQKQRSPLYRHIRKSPFFSFRRIAAVLSGLLLAGVALYVYFFTAQHNRQANIPNTPVTVADTVRTLVPKGQKLLASLPDGSKVKINSGSKVWFVEGFATGGRKVYLEGEAFFEVVKDSLSPFRVISKGVMTEVLGTAFNVKAYAEQEAVKVIVAHGKVRASSLEEKVEAPVLQRGQMAVFQQDKVVKKEANLAKELAWKDNILYLEKASFEEVLEELANWYGVTFVVSNDVHITGRISGRFKDAALKDVLLGLGFSSKFEYQLKQDTVWFNPKQLPPM